MSDRSTPRSQSSALQEEDSLLGQIADEYLQRLNRGEPARIEEYVERYPHLAAVIGQVLPALQAIRPDPSQAAAVSEVSSSEPPLTGTLGDFRIFQEIGRGGMGIVYAAEQISLGRRVALKVLPFAAAMDAKPLKRFQNEAHAAARLHHTNIVPVYAVGCERGVHYYAMQFIDGQTMAALIRELRQRAGLEAAGSSAAATSALANELVSGHWAPAKRSAGKEACSAEVATGPCHPSTPTPLDATPPTEPASTQRSSTSPAFFRTVAHLGVQAAEALEHAHSKGIIHRDIKPANLLLDASGNLWITDFGLARMVSEAGLTMTGDLLGTLRYMSPEQALAKRVPMDHRTDIYSLGVTLYELLTLRPAYDGRDRQEVMQQIAFEEPPLPRRWNKAIPVELETIVGKAIGKNLAERYATAQELADDLRRFLDDKPIRAKRPTLLDRTRKWARRHPGVVATASGGLVVAVIILAVSTLLILFAYRREAEQGQRAVTALYHSRVREAEALRQAKGEAYRSEAWQRLRDALLLETPDKDVRQLRQEAVACLGDFAGLSPITWTDFPADIHAIALHPKGGPLATGLSDGTVLLRHLSTGVPLARLVHHCPVTALAFAPEGVRLVSGCRDGTIHVWEANATREWALMRTIHTGPTLVASVPSVAFPFFIPYLDFPPISYLAVTPDGRQFGACVGGMQSYIHSTITLWDLAHGTRTASYSRGREIYECLAISPDGKFLAANCFGSAVTSKPVQRQPAVDIRHGVVLWDLNTGHVVRDLALEWLVDVDHVAFSPDSKLLACAGDGGIAVFDTITFQQQFRRHSDSGPCAFGPDSKHLAIGNRTLGGVEWWSVPRSERVAVLTYPGGLKDGVSLVAFSRDSKHLVAASPRAVRTWNLAGSGEKLFLAGHTKGIPCIAFSPNGKLLASAGKDNTVRIWDSATGNLLKPLTGFGAEVQTLAFSPDGERLATGDWAGTIQIYEVATWTKLVTLRDRDEGISRYIWALAFSPDGQYFAAGGGEYDGPGGLTLWRIMPGRAEKQAKKQGTTFLGMQRISGLATPSIVETVAFSSDSQLLAWVDGSYTVQLWDLMSSRERSFPPVRVATTVLGIAFHPHRKQLIFVAATGVPEAWDTATGQRAYSFAEEQSKGRGGIGAGLAGTLALSSDGAWLATSNSRSVTIWDTVNRTCLLKLPEEQDVVKCLAWSTDRKLLAVGCADGGLVIWNLVEIKAQLDEIGLGW
jgi:WD40 repeat protein/serine/threonine protein kinase